MGQYQQRHDKVRSLQDGNFILPDLDPDAFWTMLTTLLLMIFYVMTMKTTIRKSDSTLMMSFAN